MTSLRLIDLLMMGESAGGAAVTYATLDPSYVQYGVTLSNGNLSLQTYDGGGACYVVAAACVEASTANKYWEVHADSVISNASNLCGIAIQSYTGGAPGGNYDGASPKAWGFAPNGAVYANQVAIVTTTGYATGDTIKFLLKNGKLYVGTVAGGWFNSGDPAAETGYVASGLSGLMGPGAGSGGASTYDWTFNFGASSWAGTPPSGATGWTA